MKKAEIQAAHDRLKILSLFEDERPLTVVEELERDDIDRRLAGIRLREIEKQERREMADKPEEMARRELARRQLCQTNFLPFVMRFNPDYQAGWVHKDICRRLEKFSDDVAARLSPRLILTMPPRHGKQIADSEPILTTEGWTTHGALKPGDCVYHPGGAPTAVKAVSAPSDEKVEMEFSNGEKIKCHPNHEWTVYDRAQAKWRTLETRAIAKRKLGDVRYTLQLPKVSALHFPEKKLLIPPYVLGAWLGDGSRGKACISHTEADTQVADRIVSSGYARSAVCVHKDTGVLTTYFNEEGGSPGILAPLRKHLRELGVEYDKYIPDTYLRCSVAQRLELLAGLMDTDGSCDERSRCRFTTADRKLADGVIDLCTTLGFRPYISELAPTLSSSGIQGTKPYWVVGFQPTMEIPCVLERKRPTRFPKHRRIGVVAVREAEPEKGRCIEVTADDGLYLVGRKLVPTHNSQLTSKSFPAWHLGKHSQHEIMACSYSGSLSMGFSRLNRELMRDPAYKVLFETRLHPDSQGAEAWMTTDGGGYTSAGIGGAITGKGAHALIIDDPVKNREDAESESGRSNAWDWYTSTAYTRLAPGGGVLLILTRWHDDDLAGRLLGAMKEGADQWTIVNYPAEAKDDELYRNAGEALHPERYDLAALSRIKRAIGPRDWAALYQQDPVPDEGAFFSKDDFEWYDYNDPAAVPDGKEMVEYAAWDLAIGQKQENDYSVGGVASIDQQGHLWMRDVVRGHWGALELCKRILGFHKKWRPARSGIEKGQIEMSIGPFLNEIKKEMGLWDFRYTELKPGRQDKVARARAIQGMVQSRKVHIPYNAPWTEDFISELLRFPTGLHDDQVDMFAWIGMMLVLMAPAIVRVERKPSWRDKLAKFSRGGDADYKSAMSV